MAALLLLLRQSGWTLLHSGRAAGLAVVHADDVWSCHRQLCGVSHHAGQHGTVCIDLRRPGLAELYLLVEYGSDVHVNASNSCVTALRAFSTWLPRLSDLLDRLGLGARAG